MAIDHKADDRHAQSPNPVFEKLGPGQSDVLACERAIKVSGHLYAVMLTGAFGAAT